MKFQLISDIHLEFYKKSYTSGGEDIPPFAIKPAAPYLILAGDIGKPYSDLYNEFMVHCSRKWKKVFVIAGNHEYYCQKRKMSSIEEKLEALNEKLPNVHYLQKSTYLLKEKTEEEDDDLSSSPILIAGCTLWSHIKNASVKFLMNDYLKIHKKNEKTGMYDRITVEDTNSLHAQCVEDWIWPEILSSKIPVLMISHHAPITKDVAPPKYRGDITNEAYCTDLEYLMEENSPIKVWCYGHNHWFNQTKVNNTNIYCNPMGYPGEETNYIENFTFTFNNDR